MKVTSIEQSVLPGNKVVLRGDVEILVDHKMHIWADFVSIDKGKQIITAWAKEGGFITFENQHFMMLANKIVLRLAEKTGHAEQVKIHIAQGFISAKRVEKIDEKTWDVHHLIFTSCDKAQSHWSFFARQATLYKNYFLKASGLFFRVGRMPVFAFPALAFPLQKRKGSGFLIPKFTVDPDKGFGFRQEYYWVLASHCDTTMSLGVVGKKGFVLSDEFRWAKSSENFLIAHASYAKERNVLQEQRNWIVNTSDDHYWVNGKFFQPYSLGAYRLQNLLRFDFGTDKRIGYHFFYDSDKVEDSFYNTIIERYIDENNIVQFGLSKSNVLRKQFLDLPEKDRIKESEEKVSVSYLPHVEWNTGYYNVVPKLSYRHDIMLDHAFLHTRNSERFYTGRHMESISFDPSNGSKDTTRFAYKGTFQGDLDLFSGFAKIYVEPHVQLRGNGYRSFPEDSRKSKSREHGRLFARVGAEYAFPEVAMSNNADSSFYYSQSLVRWSYLAKFDQRYWYHMDAWDRFYPENKIEAVLRQNWLLGDVAINTQLRQGYDFFERSEIFPLRRCYNQRHFVPLSVDIGCSYKDNVHVQWNQEYSLKNTSLIQSNLTTFLRWKKFEFSIGHVYQREQLRQNRGLLSDIPSFALIGCTIPFSDHALFRYDGSFYSTDKRVFPFLNSFKPTLHRVRFDYNGHCWGVSLGFEEKQYRQYGQWKSERAITFALRLESIGSFAQKFKRPVIYRASEEYEG